MASAFDNNSIDKSIVDLHEQPKMAPPSTYESRPPLSVFDQLVEINVGMHEEEKSFHFSEGLLCFYSGYFDKALNGDWRESKRRVVMLENDDPEVFSHFQYWIHRMQICDPSEAEESDDVVQDLAVLWIFGDGALC